MSGNRYRARIKQRILQIKETMETRKKSVFVEKRRKIPQTPQDYQITKRYKIPLHQKPGFDL